MLDQTVVSLLNIRPTLIEPGPFKSEFWILSFVFSESARELGVSVGSSTKAIIPYFLLIESG